jgi:multidrug resistance efflux pump
MSKTACKGAVGGKRLGVTWKRLLLVVGLLAAVGVALGFLWPFGRHEQFLQIPGVVEIQEVRLGSKIGGRVARVAVREGDMAEPGQPLVYLEVPELEAQRDQLQASLAAMEADLEKWKNGPRPEEKRAAQEAVEAAKARWEVLKIGSRSEEIREARSQYESAQADLKLAREDFDRAARLYRQQNLSRAEYDAARATLERSQGNEAKTKAHLDLLVAGNRPEEIQQALAQLKQAQANYDLLLAGSRSEDIAAAEARAAQSRAKLHEIEANLKEAVVRAPERVLIEVLGVRKGDLVAPNQPILRVLRADDLWVRIYIPETQLGQIRLHEKVVVTIDPWPDRHFEGEITQISSESEFTPRNVQSADERRFQVFSAKVHVDDPQGIFKSGMAAQVTVPLREAGARGSWLPRLGPAE